MSPQDEAELHRLCDLIRTVDEGLPEHSELREALQKAAIALHWAFMRGLRVDIEQQYAGIGAPLSEEQQTYLRSLGIDPDAE